ncbi:transmembrane emp24 domain-containing protein 1 [Alligator sinensis]|uniref:Transmembrane emp24 domain-containing protein 1 n=1 Tax=Alligator sinensis TaxID=38654 RepID=A0A3Q0GN52_ALLSI|nr:transmembrane emp24 domain-containing protein 1 [Alligator sinensis]
MTLNYKNTSSITLGSSRFSSPPRPGWPIGTDAMERAGLVFKGAAAGAQIRMMAAAWHGLWLLLLAGAPGPWGAAALPAAQPPPDVEFTFLLPAGAAACVVQGWTPLLTWWLLLQVIGGAGLDVDFSLESPSGVLLINEYRKSDGVHTIEPTEAGDYKLCFDNSFSTISEKLVFFELLFDSPQDEEDAESWAEAVEPEDMLDVKIEDIKESIETMKSRLERSIQMQTLLRAFEARDRNLQESNLGRVNFWSAVNLGVLVVVAFLQVYMLKSLFEDKRKVRT